MRNINLTTAGAICAVITTLSFVVGVAFSAGSGVPSERGVAEKRQAGGR